MLDVKFMAPDKTLYNGTADHIVAKSTDGEFAIYVNHINIIANLEISQLKIVDNNLNNHIFTISGGYLFLENNKLTILTKSAENLENIDVRKAEEKRKKLEELISSGTSTSSEILELKLKKQLNRIEAINGTSHL